MSAYIIAIKLTTKDVAELATYGQKARQARLPEQKMLVAYGKQQILEGPSHEGVVVIEFPDKDAALRWYNSDAYQEAREHRLKGGDYQFTLVEGVSL